MQCSRWTNTLLLGAVLFLTDAAAVGHDAAAPASDGRSAIDWLRAIQTAAMQADYTGTITYQRGDEIRSSHIVHYFDGTAPRERVLMLDGRPREFIREGDEVHCLYPKVRRLVIEHAGAHASFPALGHFDVSRVLEHYVLTAGALERVAGIDCRVLQLTPRDSLRYGYKLWVESKSGLLLKVQVLGTADAVIEQIAFSDVRIGEPISMVELKPSWSTTGWDVVQHASHKIELIRQGWSVTAPEGFQVVTEVERSLRGDSNQAALQAVYSDGLATISVFIEPGAAQADPGPLQQHGPFSAFMRRVGDARITAVGEVPPETTRSIADSVRFVASH